MTVGTTVHSARVNDKGRDRASSHASDCTAASKMRVALTALVLAIWACGDRSTGVVKLPADPRLLRTILHTWQEGPTDGRICLDPRVLALGDSAAAQPPREWADSVLRALQADTMIAIDTSVTRRADASRACVPTRDHPRISLSMPRFRGDSATVESQALLDSAPGIGASRVLDSAVLRRSGRNWIFAQRSAPDYQTELMPVIPCVDLSGRYVLQGEDGQVFVTIDQTECQRIAIDWGGSVEHQLKSDKHDLALDGEFHDDADWFGEQGRQSTSATFVGWGIQLVGKPTSTADTFVWKHNLDPLPNGDLCSRFLDPHLEGWSNSRLQRSSARGVPRGVPARPEPECR